MYCHQRLLPNLCNKEIIAFPGVVSCATDWEWWFHTVWFTYYMIRLGNSNYDWIFPEEKYVHEIEEHQVIATNINTTYPGFSLLGESVGTPVVWNLLIPLLQEQNSPVDSSHHIFIPPPKFQPPPNNNFHVT